MRPKIFRFEFVEEKTEDLNKADPFGGAAPASELASDEGQGSGEPGERADEPVQADHIGALLCATRMRTGGDLQEIAKILRIRYGYLVAIEDGRHEDLPGSAYSIGFVRAYADYLGLDGNEVVRRLREETDGTVTKTRFEFPIPSTESGLPNGGLLAIAVTMGMVVYGAWYTMTNADRDAVDLIQEVPGRLAVLIDEGDAVQSAEVIEPMPVESQVPENQVELAANAVSSETGVGQDEGGDELDVMPDAGAPDAAANDEMVSETQDDTVASDIVTADADVVVPAIEEAPVEPAQDLAEAEAVVAEVVSVEPVPVRSAPVEPENTVVVEPEIVEPESVPAPEQSPTQGEPSVDVEVVAESTDPVDEDVVVASESIDAAPIELANETPDGESIEPSSEVAMLETEETPPVDVAETAVVVEPTETGSEELEVQAEADADASTVTEAAATETTPTATDPEEPLVIELRAKSDSWIQVRDGNELLLTRLLREGEVYQVPGRDGLTLMTGNAGGLEVFVGGELMPPLGDVGAVRRGVPLSAERLRSGVAPS